MIFYSFQFLEKYFFLIFKIQNNKRVIHFNRKYQTLQIKLLSDQSSANINIRQAILIIITINYCMNKNQADIQDKKFIEDLCRLGPDKQKYLILLKKKGILTYLSFNQFREQILKTTSQHENFIRQFQKQYNQYMQSENKLQEDVRFPWIKHKDAKFARINIQRFMAQYELPIDKNDEKIQKNQREDMVKYQQQFFMKNQSELLPEFNYEDQQQVEEYKIESVIPPSNKQGAYISEEELKQNEEVRKIPPFLYNQARPLATLTGLDFTLFFERQLTEVTLLIERQTTRQYLLKVYCDFVDGYMHTKYINDGDCCGKYTQSIQKEQIKKFIQEYTPGKSDQKKLLNIWNDINQKFQALLTKQKKQQADNIKDIILKGINSVYIVFNLNIGKSAMYGVTFHSTISINVNNFPYSTLNFDQFRYTLKPYIALTIYHQLAHYLIRKIDLAKINQSGISFNFQTQSIGKTLLETVQKIYNHVPQYLKLCQTNRQFYFSQFAQEVRQFLKKYQSLCDKLQQKNQKLQKITTEITKILQVDQLIREKVRKIDWEQSLNNLDHYIEHLKLQPPQDPPAYKQLQYKFFFAYFATPHLMSFFIKTPQAKQKYQHIVKKIKESKIKIFYLEDNDNSVIEDFLNRINQKNKSYQQRTFHFGSTLAHYLMDKSLDGSQKFDQLKQLQELWNELGDNNIKEFILKAGYFHNQYGYLFKSTFKQFKLTKWQQQDKFYMIKSMFNMPQIDQLKGLIDATQYYQIFKNYVNYAQVLQICNQMPAFYMQQHSPTTRPNKKFESGFVIEKMMFPTLYKSGRIYAKDYKFMKNIELQKNRIQIGKQPLSPEQIRFSMRVERGSNENPSANLHINLRHGQCGNYLRKIQIYNRKMRAKKLEDAKMKKDKAKQS